MSYSDDALQAVCRRFRDMMTLSTGDDDEGRIARIIQLSALAGIPADRLPFVLDQLEALVGYDSMDYETHVLLHGVWLGVTLGLLTAGETELMDR